MSRRFEFQDTPLEGLQILQRQPLADNRGYLERMFCSAELGPLLSNKNIVQINHTMTHKRGAVRGLHFQYPPHADTKFISCLRGEVFDIAVDLRADSPTFLKWHATILSAAMHNTFVIPEGFAHGYQTLTAECEMLYLHTASYQPSVEGGVNIKDPQLAIDLPLPITELAERDANYPMLKADYPGVLL